MKKKSFFLYLLVFASAALIFTFLLFPQKELAAYLSNSTANSALHISIDAAKPAVPFKLKLVNARLTIGRTAELAPQSMVLKFTPAFIFNQNKPLEFHSDFYEGNLNGHIQLGTFDPLSISQMDLEMSGVRIDNFNYKTGLADMNLSCRLDGRYKYSRKGSGGPSGNGEQSGYGTVEIQNLAAAFQNSLFNTLNMPLVEFSKIRIEFTQSDEKITIKQCVAKGAGMNMNLEGKINLATPLQSSKLNLTGIIRPDSLYSAKFAASKDIKATAKSISKNGIKFNLNGTLKNPKIAL